MRQRKRKSSSLLGLASVILLLSALLAACGGSNNAEEPAANAEPSADSKSEPAKADAKPVKFELMDITWGTPMPAEADDFSLQMLNEKLNIDLTVNSLAGWDDYMNQINVRVASGNYPDLFRVLSRAQLQDFAEKGLLMDLTPHMDKLGQVKELLGADLDKGLMDGKQYAIPKKTQIPYHSLWIRQDWLDAVGMQKPTTLEELLAVAKAFTFNDPDGNGANDTYGFTGKSLFGLMPIFNAYGMGYPTEVYLEDGKPMVGAIDPDMKDAIAFMQQMLAAKVVDPELLANTANQDEQKAYQGKVGIFYTDFPKLVSSANAKTIQEANPNAKWVPVEPLKGPKGTYAGTLDAANAPGLYVVPKDLSEEKLAKVFELLNFVSGEEGNKLVSYGEEGRHYTMKDNKMERDKELSSKELHFLYQITGRDDREYLINVGYPEDVVNFSAEAPRLTVYNGYLGEPEGLNRADADRYVTEELSKFIYNQRPLSEFDAYVDTLMNKFKYHLVLEDAEKTLKENGIIQ